MNRRTFVRGTATAATGITLVPRHVLGGQGFTAPSDELTKAIIGVGGMGRGHIGYEGARLLAVCDVDEAHLARAVEEAGPGVDTYRDFREVLDRPDIDIVHIATPPHWHGLMAIAAADAGKDIWCEKPMTRTIGEGIKVVEAVQRNDPDLSHQHLVPLPLALLRHGHDRRRDQEGGRFRHARAGR